MVGVNGGKFPAIREHLQANIAGAYKDMDVSSVNCPALQIYEIPVLNHATIASTHTHKKEKSTQRPVSLTPLYRRSPLIGVCR